MDEVRCTAYLLCELFLSLVIGGGRGGVGIG